MLFFSYFYHYHTTCFSIINYFSKFLNQISHSYTNISDKTITDHKHIISRNLYNNAKDHKHDAKDQKHNPKDQKHLKRRRKETRSLQR